ncbi:MAG: cell division protein FtsL [Pseudomonadales bacterium]|jgi:cell division protein FtsL|nr:cell division protein FtsL [Pseudomonadales bacterium]MCP5321527.1 cell division protein FtsL [Pseudomonadales bacterium]MCP5336440.1 cell division protein FtsL [Pseudomonadales bacterium]
MADVESALRAAPGRNRWPWLALVLLVLVVASSFGVIYTAHSSRELFRQLEQARRDENEIQNEWRQLLLERGTLSSHARVEAIARERLRMVPVEGEFRVLVGE